MLQAMLSRVTIDYFSAPSDFQSKAGMLSLYIPFYEFLLKCFDAVTIAID